MPHEDLVRGLLNSRSAHTPLAFSPAQTADTFSLRSPRQQQSPSFTQWSESPSVYSRSRMSVDSCSDFSGDDATTSGHYHARSEHSEVHMASVLQIRRGTASEVDMSDSGTIYRESYVDPLRDSSDDERPTEGKSNVPGSHSDDTLSDTGMLRPGESDTSLSSAVSGDATPDPRLSFLGPKTRLISKAPWEEDGTIAEEEAVSDSECPTDAISVFAGKIKEKVRTRSKTLTQAKAEKERRFLVGGWGRTSTDTRQSLDSSKRSMDSSMASYLQTPISPRSGSFSEAIRMVARTPSTFSASSGASSGPAHTTFAGRGGLNRNISGGISISSYDLDSRTSSPAPSGSPTSASFVHPYANPELIPPGHDGEAPSRSNSSTTLTASTASLYITPSSSSSSTTSPGQDDRSSSSKKEKRRPPQISVAPLNRGPAMLNPTKSPSALSTSFIPLSPPMTTSPAALEESIPSGMLGFPGSPAFNLISLEQAQQKVRERSRSNAGSSQGALSPLSPRPKELLPKKSMGSLVGLGGGFSYMIAGGSPSPNPNWAEDGRARTVSAGSGLTRPRGYTASSIATQSTTSVNIIQGGGIENIPDRSKTDSAAATPDAAAKTLKPKRSGILRFFKDKGSSNGGNPNISAPSTPVHIAHNTLEPPPVPKLPAQFQTPKSSSPSELESRRDRPPPVVVSSPSRPRSPQKARSSDDFHAPIGEHRDRPGLDKRNRTNPEPSKQLASPDTPNDQNFSGLRLRPMSSVFSGLPDDYLSSSPKNGSGFANPGSRGSSESRAADGSGFEDTNALSPVTPFFAHSQASVRSTFTHASRGSSGSDAFSSSVDPRTPSSSGFPRSSTESQSAATIAALREQIELLRKASNLQISELENQVRELKDELEATKCDRCGQQSRPSEQGVINRPRARAGTGCRAALGSSYD